MSRNYRDLSPFDFECLVRDLFQSKWSDQTVEVFPPGPDGGIDVRVLRSAVRPVYIQCKHYEVSGFSKLQSAIKKEAASISEAVSKGEYWLVTSCYLTLHNKDELSGCFEAGFLPIERIVSGLDVDNLLNQYPQVEINNYKLYMTSASVMQRLLYAETLFRQRGLFVDSRERVRTFVPTPALSKAKEILKSRRSCIITGEPGTGKSTLAEVLILELAEKGYECIPVSKDIEEAERAFNPGGKQVFYYDDFLGQTSADGDKLAKNEDSRLVSFMARLQREEDHYLILTTREYLYRQAVHVHEKIDSPLVRDKKFVLNLSSYNELHRAHILYNHLYYSNLPAYLVGTMLQDGRYRQVVRHKNYNPRLIELAIQLAGLELSQLKGSLAEFFVKVLDNPVELWKHAFSRHISAVAQDCLLVLASLPRDCGIEDFKAALASFQADYRRAASEPHVVRRAIADLDGVFLTLYTGIFLFQEESAISIYNPSFRDYLHLFIDENPEIGHSLLRSAVRFEQAVAVSRWIYDGRFRSWPRNGKVVMPDLRAILVRERYLLTSTMLRLLPVPDCAVSGSGMVHSPWPVDQGERVEEVVRAGLDIGLSAEEMDPIVIELALFLDAGASNAHLRRLDKASALDAVRLIQPSSGPPLCGSFAFDTLADAVEGWFQASLDTPSDHVFLVNLAIELHGYSTEWYLDEFRNFVDEYWRSFYENEPSELPTAYEEIQEAANELGYTVDGSLDDIFEEIQEVLDSEYELESEVDDRVSREIKSGQLTFDIVSYPERRGDAISDLFGTLGGEGK
ncbi:hypothetical protein F4560_006193 [Saccharothrix ecbatanensis]|uniref:Restriction endonuclease n=1 Tax=Saccharothrix ecbatanensis TaxID=1105145 RepID=A0A7W9M3V0_9PSEU|nr:restriction endonuclease [Saccharothrix ecbatanensis]MBB5806425.1 hypothetical protein [Saccharothrix ecbatanensis]